MFVTCFGLVSVLPILLARKTPLMMPLCGEEIAPQSPGGIGRLWIFFSFAWFDYVAVCSHRPYTISYASLSPF